MLIYIYIFLLFLKCKVFEEKKKKKGKRILKGDNSHSMEECIFCKLYSKTSSPCVLDSEC